MRICGSWGPAALTVFIALIAAWPTVPCRADDDVVSPPSERARISRGDIAVEADRIDGDMTEVYATGDVRFTAPEGVFTADSGQYNFLQRSGYLRDVTGHVEPYHFRAALLEMDPQTGQHLRGGAFTTCTRERPHYQLLIRDFRIDPDNQHYDARRISVEYGGHKLFTIPHFRGKLGDDEKSMAPSITSGVSRLDGGYVGLNYTQALGHNTDLLSSVRVGTRGTLRGGLTLAAGLDLPKPFGEGTLSLIASRREDVANRVLLRTYPDPETLRDLTVSRLPAVHLSLAPVTLPGDFRLRLGGGYGRYYEQPTGVESDRTQLWGILRTPRLNVGPALLGGEYGFRHVAYPAHHISTRYLQISATSRPNARFYYEAAYLHTDEVGNTPFLFDRVLVPDELFTAIEAPVTRDNRWALGVWHRRDLSNGQTLDYNVMGIYREDCLSYSLYYNHTSHTVGVGLVVNAFGDFRRRPPSVSFTQ